MNVLARLALFAGTLVFLSSVHAQNQIAIKFSHVVAPDTPKGKAAELFKKLLEQRSEGRIKVEVFANASLYTDSEELHALRSGDVQMLAPSVSKFAPLGLPEFEIFDMPYLIGSDEAWQKATQHGVGQSLLKKLDEKGITGLTYWSGGVKHISANRELRHPGDMQGLRLRIQPSKVTEMHMRALGARPLAIPFSSIQDSLRGGMVDGLENTASNIHASEFYKLQKFLTMTGHGYLGYAVVINKRFWDGLPPSTRKLIGETLAEVTEYQQKIAAEDNERAIKSIKDSGKTRVIALSANDQAEWRRISTQTSMEMERRVGMENVQQLKSELGIGR